MSKIVYDKCEVLEELLDVQKDEVDIEECFQQCGSFGRYQAFLQILLMLFVLCFGLVPYLPYFIIHDPPWVCKNSTNAALTNATTNEFCRHHPDEEIMSDNPGFSKRCEMKKDEWKYTKSSQYSIVTEFGLICERSYLADLTTTLFCAGAVISGVVSGKCADTFGRQSTMLILLLLTIVGSLGTFLVNQMWQLFVLRLIHGIGDPLYNLGLIYLMELVPAKYQSLCGLLYAAPYSFSLLFLDGVAYLVRDWRYLQLYVSLPLCLFIIPFVFLVESPRWLVAVGKRNIAEDKLKKIARINGKVFSKKVQAPSNQDEKYNYLDFFSNRTVAFVISSQAFLWFTMAMSYFMFGLDSSRLGGNIYQVFAFSWLLEIPSTFATIYLVNKYGRKKTILISFFISGIFTATIATVPPSFSGRHLLNISMALSAKFFVTIAYHGIYVWSFELIPTVVRSQGMLLLSVLENTSALLVPFLVGTLQNELYALPFIVTAVLTMLAVLMGIKLPETHNRPTREVFEDFFEKDSEEGLELLKR